MANKINTSGELLDLVDENDEVIGQVDRDKANHDPTLVHREVAVLVYDHLNRVLLQQRSFKKKHDPGLWQIAAAGHVPSGMSYEEAVHKELREELGFDTTLKFVGKILYKDHSETRFDTLFIGKYNGEKTTPEKNAVEKIQFFSEGEFEKKFAGDKNIDLLTTKGVRKFWRGDYNHLKD